jgi:acetylglutamate synthase
MSFSPDLDRQLADIRNLITGLAKQLAKDRTDNFAALNQVRKAQEKAMATLDQILSDVTEQATMIDGVSTMISGLRQQVAEAVAKTGMPAEDQAKIDAIFDSAEANKAKLAGALATNTDGGATST